MQRRRDLPSREVDITANTKSSQLLHKYGVEKQIMLSIIYCKQTKLNSKKCEKQTVAATVKTKDRKRKARCDPLLFYFSLTRNVFSRINKKKNHQLLDFFG